jgi:uncharacterized protein
MGIAQDLKSDREFQVFIKPVGPECNLACRYCYYLKISGVFDGKLHLMPDETLERFTRQNIQATTGPVITFSWHGGEPLLAGIDFYRRAVSFQKKYCPSGKRILNGIQTNGTLINESWCRFFSEEKFLVGLSMDGPAPLHDIHRKDRSGKGTFSKVLHAFDQLTMYGIDAEILCVVNRNNGDYPLETYRFFRELGVSFITFIPLVENREGQISSSSVDPSQFGSFLCRIFDEWKDSDTGKIKVQIFEEALRSAFRQPHTLCVFRPECGGVPVVEHNGNYYSCDHYVNDSHFMGNNTEVSLLSVLDNEKQKTFGKAKSSSLPAYCRQCEVKEMCNGECPKNRFILSPDGEPGLNYLCRGYRQFFNHVRPFVRAVAAVGRNNSNGINPVFP